MKKSITLLWTRVLLDRTPCETLCRSFSTTQSHYMMKRLRKADEETAVVKKKQQPTESKVKKVANVEEISKLNPIQSNYPPLDNTKYWSKRPVDDVWIRRHYPPRAYTFAECIQMHKEACIPEIYNCEHNVVTMNLLLCMKTKKKTKFSSYYGGNIQLPHRFDTGLPKRRIMALSSNPEEVEVARSLGATFFGGLDIIRQIQNDDIKLQDQVDTIVCTTDILQELIAVKDKVPDFPSKSKGTTGHDMSHMVSYFTTCLSYKSESHKRDEGDPRVTRLRIPVGTLSMPVQNLEENWLSWKDTLEKHRQNQNLDSVILEAKVRCWPSPESFRLDLKRKNILLDEEDDKLENSKDDDSDDEK